MVGIEHEFKVTFTTAEIDSPKSAGDLLALVRKKSGAREEG
jgi:hypothetical protein